MYVKKKMNNQKFRRIWVGILSFVIILATAATIGMNMFAPVMDSYLGRGKMHVNYAEGTKDWDTDYYPKKEESLAKAKEHSYEIAEQVGDEGIVLLKNNGALPLEKGSEVAPFGYAYLNPAYAGTGAAASADKDMITVEQGLSKYFTVNSEAAKKMKSAKPAHPGAAKGTRPLDFDVNSLQAMMDKGNSSKINEYDVNIYNGIEKNIKESAGLVFINRNGSEGLDKRTDAYDDGTPHYLALTQKEKDTIKYVKENCMKCIVILNTANPMELTDIMTGEYEADAILWVGTPGSMGFDSMGKILSGMVNPSGKLTDIYASDFTKDPTFVNFGEFSYTNSKVTDTTILDFIPGANKGTIDRKFVEYEEGIYVGYRYYETADVEDPDFVYGELDGMGGIKTPGAVAYPFGYGLSYTTFEKEIIDFNAKGDNVKVTVKVTNTGENEGKDVVQIYATPPYTDYDKENKVEKSATELAGFAKTKMIKPGESETVTVEFAKEDMASYDFNHGNDDGTTGCYLLEAGEYIVDLKENSHDVIESKSFDVTKTVVYQGDHLRDTDKEAQSALDENGESLNYPANGKDYVAVSNQFDTLNEYMNDSSVTNLSRSDWKNTFPTMPEDRKSAASQVALDDFEHFDNFDVNTDEELGNVKGSKVYTDKKTPSGQENGLSLIDMRGLDYYDEAWDKLLDQIDWSKEKEEIQKLLYNAAYQTGKLDSINKPATTDKDGAMGWSIEGASSWASANLMACTWNTELLYEVGAAIGQEALQADLSGWYAPAVNIHRSPFGGRVYEYYSEDGLLSGKVATAVIEGASDQGVFCYLKHLVLNEQETYRAIFLATWANEQALREVYLKPFEICLKEAKNTLNYISDNEGNISSKVIRSATGIMTAQNSIGGTIGFADYGLITGVLRDEWGFKGAVITDLYPSNLVSLRDMTLRSGGDLFMNQTGYYAKDYDSPTSIAAMRKAIHNVGYMTVNSNSMNGLAPGITFYYEMSPWEKCLIAGDMVAGILAVIIIFWIVFRFKDEKKNPDKYLKKGEKKNTI